MPNSVKRVRFRAPVLPGKGERSNGLLLKRGRKFQMGGRGGGEGGGGFKIFSVHSSHNSDQDGCRFEFFMVPVNEKNWCLCEFTKHFLIVGIRELCYIGHL